MAGPTTGIARRPAIQHELGGNPRLGLRQRLAALAPGLAVLRTYQRPWWRADVFAGIAVAAYLVPQVMAYAAIVDVPPVAGLWTALACCLVYAVLGSSRMLSVGPESTVALMAGATVGPMSGGDPQRAATLAAALSLIVAAWCFVARLARLGVVADLLSQPLLVGYLAGGAVLMVVGQLGRLTGTSVGGETIVDQVRSFVTVAPKTHWPTVAVGAATLAVLLGVLAFRPRWPATLIAVGGATLVSTLTHLADHGVKAVGTVPSGLPLPHLPSLDAADLETLVIAGLGVALVAYSDNSLIARAFAARPTDEDGHSTEENTDVDPDQELVALGGAHVLTGLLGGFPASSSGSRTALAAAAGARTQVYSLVAGAVVLLVLLAAGPLISGLPAAALGAVVVYAASKLVSVREFVRLARFRPTELVLAVVALVGTITLGILAGVAVTIALSLLEMARRLARPHEGVLGRVPGLPGMHDVDDYPGATTLPGLIVYRYDAPLFFANVGDLRRRVLMLVEQENAADPEHPVRWFVLNVEANVEIDITAADVLTQLHDELRERGVRLGLARVKHDLLLPLQRAGLADLIGADMLFPTLPVAEDAYVAWATAQDAAFGDEQPGDGTADRALSP